MWSDDQDMYGDEEGYREYIADQREERAALEAAQPTQPDALGPCGCSDYHYADCPIRG